MASIVQSNLWSDIKFLGAKNLPASVIAQVL